MGYSLISDTHHHNWRVFANDSDAVNSRLQITLDETWRAANEAKDRGHSTLVHAGDMFHVRGKVAPSVLNPTLEMYDAIVNGLGMRVIAISGNHDLEGNDSTELGSAMSAMRRVGVTVCNEPTRITTWDGDDLMLIPWINSVAELKRVMEDHAKDKNDIRLADLIIHAPVNGVITGLPDHGLEPEYLSKLGFRRVFAGHYHNHKNFDDTTYSIGALTHQNWGDIGSKAGFLHVNNEKVEWRKSHAPEFVEINGEMDETEIRMIADGNYVRATIAIEEESTLREMRQELYDMGAAGVVLHPIRKPKSSVTARTTSIKSGASLEASVGDFIKARKFDNEKELGKVCTDILGSVEAAE